MSSALREQIIQTVERAGSVRLAILFGSLAAGTAGRWSDLDLAILLDRPITPTATTVNHGRGFCSARTGGDDQQWA